MRDASAHLQRLTHGRYVFDIAYRGRAITLQIMSTMKINVVPGLLIRYQAEKKRF